MKKKHTQQSTKLIGLLAGPVFIFNALIFFFQAFTKNLYPPLLLPLREAYAIDHAQAGLLVTLVFFGYALARFPSGILADLIGCTRTVLIGSAAMAVSFIGVALASTYILLAVTTFILGISSGIYVTAGYTLAVVIGSRARATTATATFESFGVLASVISPLLVTLFVVSLRWQYLFGSAGILLAVVTFLFYRLRSSANQYEYTFATQSGSDQRTVMEGDLGKGVRYLLPELYKGVGRSFQLFHQPQIRRFILWSTLVGGFGALSWMGINSFIPSFLVEERGYSYELANRIFVIIALSGLLAKIATGWLADRIGNIPVLLFNLICGVLLFITLTLVEGYFLTLLILALLGALCFNTNTLINAHVLRHIPIRYQGAGFGFFCTAYTVIYSLGPYLTGFFTNLYGLNVALRISSFGAIVAILLILAVNRFIPQGELEKMNIS